MSPRAGYALAAAIAAAYLYAFPYFEEVHNANELPRIWLTQALVDEQRCSIDTGVARYGMLSDVGETDRADEPHSHVRGRYYSIKAPGVSFFAVPTYLLLRGAYALAGTRPSLRTMTYWFRLTTSTLPALLFLLLLAAYLARVCDDRVARRVALVGYALGSLAFPTATLFAGHQLAAALAMTSFILVAQELRGELRPRALALAGLCAGLALMTDYQAAFFCVPTAVHLLAASPRGRRVRAALFAAAGAIGPVTLLLIYHHVCFGAPWRTGYSTSKMFAEQFNQGFIGLTLHPRRAAFIGSFFSTDNGLFVLSPLLLLALPGALDAARSARTRADGWVGLAALAIGAWFISSLAMWRGGWSLGPRYLTAVVPFLVVPLAIALARLRAGSPVGWTIAVALAVPSLVTYGVLTVVYPTIPVYESTAIFLNPLYDVGLTFLRRGLAPYSAGRLVGLRGAASLAPYFAIVAAALLIALFDAAEARAQRWATMLGLVAGALLVALISLAPRGHYRTLDCYGHPLDGPDSPNCLERIARKYEPKS